MKRHLFAGLVSCMLVIAAVIGIFPGTASAAPEAKAAGPDIYGYAYCVMNADTGEVVCQRNMEETLYPASTTKIMTCLVALENNSDLSKTVTFSDNAVNGIDIHSSTLEPKAKVGEQMSLENVLYGMMLASGNECAVAVAEATSGDESTFVDLMNKRAQEIGAVNTHFMNPHGLHDDQHYTTCYDMALMFKTAIQNSEFLKITSTAKYTIPATNMTEARNLSHGHMMISGDYDYSYAVAGKSGQTDQAGRTLVTLAEKDGIRLITVVFKSTHQKIWMDTQILFDYSFDLLEGKCTAISWTPVNETWTSEASLNVRQYVNTCSDILDVYNAGDPVNVVATWGEWAQVKVDDMTGYVQLKYLTDPSTVVTEAPTETETEAVTEAETVTETETEEATVDESTEAETEDAGEAISDVVNNISTNAGLLWAIAIVSLLLAGAIIWFIVLLIGEDE